MKQSVLLLTTLILLASLAVSKSEYKVTSVNKTASTIYLGLQYIGKDDYYVKPTSPIIK